MNFAIFSTSTTWQILQILNGFIWKWEEDTGKTKSSLIKDSDAWFPPKYRCLDLLLFFAPSITLCVKPTPFLGRKSHLLSITAQHTHPVTWQLALDSCTLSGTPSPLPPYLPSPLIYLFLGENESSPFHDSPAHSSLNIATRSRFLYAVSNSWRNNLMSSL